MNKKVKARIAGCLEVTATKDARLGISDKYAPAGSVGYVLGVRKYGSREQWFVYWPVLKTDGSHYAAELTPTGNRG